MTAPSTPISLHPDEQSQTHTSAASDLRDRVANFPSLNSEGLLPAHATALNSALTAAKTLLSATAHTHEVGADGATALGGNDKDNSHRYDTVPDAQRGTLV